MATPFNLGDVTNSQRLYYLLQRMQAKLTTLESQLAKEVAKPVKLDSKDIDQLASYLQTDLSARGLHPLPVTGLAGQLAEPQAAAPVLLSSDPLTTVNPDLYEPGTLATYNNNLYLVVAGRPHTWSLFSLALPANAVTTDTVQTIGPGAAKTVSDLLTLLAGLAVTGKTSLNGEVQLSLESANAATYTIIGSSFFVGNVHAGATTIKLPPAPTGFSVYVINDAIGGAGAGNITVNGNGNNINGAATALINTNYGSLRVYFSGGSWLTW